MIALAAKGLARQNQRMDKAAFSDAIAAKLLASDIADQWSQPSAGTTTRFAVVDDLLPRAWAGELASLFPQDDAHFDVRSSFRERKRTSVAFDALPAGLHAITQAFQTAEVVEVVTDALGIRGMSGDPTLYAGGLSVMRRGDFLNPHIDNSHEATRRRYRRVNLLYYTTPDFPADQGGNLELWDDRVHQPVTIHSRFNRLVLMETNSRSWHSVSPLRATMPRRCVSNYYFSPISPDGREYYHVTSFTGRPDQPLHRAVAAVDNGVRQLARRLGASRRTDQGYRQVHAAISP